MKAIILVAGVGSRLGKPFPKSLCPLPDGQTILSRQVSILKENGINHIPIIVGFKKEMLIEHIPDTHFVENPDYESTNTSKSLLMALENVDEDCLWLK